MGGLNPGYSRGNRRCKLTAVAISEDPKNVACILFASFINSKKMKTETVIADEVRMRLVEEGGRAAQDLGVGRIPGQILVYLYLSDGERSLDQIEADLGLSKAAASGATRQLEGLGFLKRVWRRGDRRVYFRTADNLGEVFREGLVAIVRRKVESISGELDRTTAMIDEAEVPDDPEIRFLSNRIKRAKDLSDRASRILNSRILRYLSR